ncbi:MAG: exosortase system-associated protein, TIGR04073 family [Verrucomicrobiota bacterium]|nr:exosortase system-associated protein, TIGR04073 family [Verrucomicrobiota bacterium]
MRNASTLLAAIALAALFTAGCAGPEQKFGRGMRNTYEIVRLGELRRSVEQTSVFYGDDVGYTTGFIAGLDRSLARTGAGLYDMITFPIPPYDQPPLPNYLAPEPVYPDSSTPGLISSPTLDTDTYIGFSGGEVAPFIPGSRFKVFDN